MASRKRSITTTRKRNIVLTILFSIIGLVGITLGIVLPLTMCGNDKIIENKLIYKINRNDRTVSLVGMASNYDFRNLNIPQFVKNGKYRVKNIADYAFAGNMRIVGDLNWTPYQPSGCLIGEEAFRLSTLEGNVNIGIDSSGGYGNTWIGPRAFMRTSIKSFHMGNLKIYPLEFYRECFAHCGSLTNFEIDTDSYTIHEETFYGDVNLSTIVIPSWTSDNKIESNSFAYCNDLSTSHIYAKSNEADAISFRDAAFPYLTNWTAQKLI